MSSEATLLLRLAAPTQGWDTRRARADMTRRPLKRDLPAEALAPTRSAIAGLLGAALGRERTDLHDLLDLESLVRADQTGVPRTEFRTSRRRTQTGPVSVPLIESVLDDAMFVAGVGGPRELLNAAEAALWAPRWALFLGKREFPPTLPISLGVVDGPPEQALRGHAWLAADWYRRRQPQHVQLRLFQPLDQRRTRELPTVSVPNPLGKPDLRVDWLAALR